MQKKLQKTNTKTKNSVYRINLKYVNKILYSYDMNSDCYIFFQPLKYALSYKYIS